MTSKERQLLRTCISNGFEFHSDDRKRVKIGDEIFDFDRLNELAFEFEEALDRRTAQKPDDIGHFGYNEIYIYGKCPICGDGVNYEFEYCPKCGQKLDWREDENESKK